MADAIGANSENDDPPPVEHFIDLFAGGALNSSDAETVTLRSPARLIVFAGSEGSGKTTVLASIYERFCEGPFAGFHFAGSRSLIGFEEICYLNRITSGGSKPDTPRTIPNDEVTYYHLGISKSNSLAGRRHVLMSAVSGELFRSARNSREECARLTFLHRADLVVVLIDGERLSVPQQRENAIAEASGIVSSFLDANMVNAQSFVEFVFSKQDRIVNAGVQDIVKRTQTKLEAKFRSRIPNLSFRCIAARPAGSFDSSVEDGLAEAFASWVEPKHSLPVDSGQPIVPLTGIREFDKFNWRYFNRVGGR